MRRAAPLANFRQRTEVHGAKRSAELARARRRVLHAHAFVGQRQHAFRRAWCHVASCLAGAEQAHRRHVGRDGVGV
eukprot:1109764-Pleurochrysis_carterae.AAC.1